MAVLVPSNQYMPNFKITNPGAVTNFNIQASATKPLCVVRAQIELAQATIPTAANCNVRLIRKSAAPTVTAVLASTYFNLDHISADASFTCGHTATAEGTEGDFIEFGWGSQTGWVWDWAPTPEEYITISAGTGNGLGIKHIVAPPAGVYTFKFVVHEIG